MNNKTLMENLRCIPDFPKKGINFRDVTICNGGSISREAKSRCGIGT